MLGVRVEVPIACFRKGLAREYLETEPLPPPATCYGFLLSLVGETARARHVGCRVAPVLLNDPALSVVLRTKWRIKNLGAPEFPVHPGQGPRSHYPKNITGKGGNITPDFQQLLGPVDLLIWLDSGQERWPGERLEARVERALTNPASISRFGGLCLGESTHLVDSVRRFVPDERRLGRAFFLADRGRLTLPVWVDHVGSAGTRQVTGDLVETPLTPPPVEHMPRIEPPEGCP
jgi:CRISPR-associated protein Cas5t